MNLTERDSTLLIPSVRHVLRVYGLYISHWCQREPL